MQRMVIRMPGKHAFLSPSSAERWVHCPPSAWLSERFPDQGSVFASEGTEAHRLCEYLLHQELGIPDVDPRPSLQYYTEEMEEAAQGYVQFIRERIAEFPAEYEPPLVMVEQQVDLRECIPESMGTADCIILGDNEIAVIDFKYGMHRVPATSLQLRIYALGACDMFKDLYLIDKVRMYIYQPRIGSVDMAEMTVRDLNAWAREELEPRAKEAFEGKGEFACGEWCRNCRARRTCRELAAHQLEIAKFDFKDPPLLTDEEISEVLSRVDGLVAWAEGVREYALKAALDGRKFAGWKLVEGKSSRKFTDDQAVAARVEVAGFDPYEKKMLGLTALEKLMGKKNFTNLLSDLVVRPQGKPILVPADDRRAEIILAKDEFAEIEEMKEKKEGNAYE